MGQQPGETLAEIAKRFGGRFRLKLRGECTAEPWGKWLIAPTNGYLEIEGGGPYPLGEVEWVELEPDCGEQTVLTSALLAAGMPATTIGGGVRVPIDAGHAH